MFGELYSPLRPEPSLICQWPGRTARGQLYLGCYHRYSMCLQVSVLPKTLENEQSLQDLSQENPPDEYRIVKDRFLRFRSHQLSPIVGCDGFSLVVFACAFLTQLQSPYLQHWPCVDRNTGSKGLSPGSRNCGN